MTTTYQTAQIGTYIGAFSSATHSILRAARRCPRESSGAAIMLPLHGRAESASADVAAGDRARHRGAAGQTGCCMDPATRLDGPAFDDAFNELVESIAILREWFAEHDPDLWVRELDRDLALLRHHDAHGLDRFLGHFGSMGSIGDVGLGDVEPVLSRAHLLARVLRRSLTR